MPPGLGIVLMDFILFVGWDLVVFEQINFPGGHFRQNRGSSKGLVVLEASQLKGKCWDLPPKSMGNGPKSSGIARKRSRTHGSQSEIIHSGSRIHTSAPGVLVVGFLVDFG